MPTIVGLAVAIVLSIVVWSVRREHKTRVGVLAEDDWTGKLLVWLLALAAFVAGMFMAYVLAPP